MSECPRVDSLDPPPFAIPGDVATYVWTPAYNVTPTAMALCCSPNPVDVPVTCWAACSVPPNILDRTADKNMSRSDLFRDCLEEQGTENPWIGSRQQSGSFRMGGPSVTAVGLLALVFGALLSF
jgi:hypothetical protein